MSGGGGGGVLLDRVRNWDVALVAWSETVRGRPFGWGATDCGSLVRAACQVMYGEDCFPAVPVWETQAGALRVVAAHGGVRAQLTRLAAVAVPLAFAQTGDVLIAPGEGEDFTDSAFVIVAGGALSANPGDVVVFHPLSVFPPDAVTLLRLPMQLTPEMADVG